MLGALLCPASIRQLCGADVWEDDPGCRPRVYTEEGECEPAESLSSLAFSEHNLLLDLLDSLGPKAAPLEEIYSETAILSWEGGVTRMFVLAESHLSRMLSQAVEKIHTYLNS